MHTSDQHGASAAAGRLARLVALVRLEHADLWLKFLFALLGLALAFAAVPAFGLRLTPGSADGIPRFPQSVQGFDLLRRSIRRTGESRLRALV